MKIVRGGIFALTLCCACTVITANAANESKKLSEISKQIEFAKKHLSETIAQENTLQTELKKSEETIGDLANKIRLIDTRIKKNNSQLQKLQQREQTLTKQLNLQHQELARQVRLAYQTDRENYIKVLFNQQNPYELSRIMTYYQYFAHAHLQEINNINSTKTSLAQTQSALEKSTDSLKELRATRVKQQQQLLSSRKQRKQVLRKIHGQVQTQHQKLNTLQANKAALEKVLHNLRQQQAQRPFIGSDFAKMKGRLSWPTRGRITHRFGSKMNQSLRYNGVFIEAPEGQGVHAIAPGKVIFANWLKGFGLLLIIDHGNGYMTLYAHCNSIYKHVGDVVTVNEPIASVGNSGGLREVGLSFEIRHNGTPLNPSSWCD